MNQGPNVALCRIIMLDKGMAGIFIRFCPLVDFFPQKTATVWGKAYERKSLWGLCNMVMGKLLVFEKGTCKILSLGKREHTTVPSLKCTCSAGCLAERGLCLACFPPKSSSFLALACACRTRHEVGWHGPHGVWLGVGFCCTGLGSWMPLAVILTE